MQAVPMSHASLSNFQILDVGERAKGEVPTPSADIVVVDGHGFHRAFAGRAGTVLQSEDGTCFRVDMLTLAALSPFFRDLHEMAFVQEPAALASLAISRSTSPSSSEATECEVVSPAPAGAIPLPSATTAGLALALSIVRDVVNPSRRGLRGEPAPLSWPSPELLDNIITIANAYDLPVVSDTLLARSRHATSAKHCFERYVLAATTDAPPALLEAAMRATLVHDVDLLGEWATRTLVRYAPAALSALYKAHLDWLRRLDEFHTAVRFRAACKPCACGHCTANRMYTFTPGHIASPSTQHMHNHRAGSPGPGGGAGGQCTACLVINNGHANTDAQIRALMACLKETTLLWDEGSMVAWVEARDCDQTLKGIIKDELKKLAEFLKPEQDLVIVFD
ncbi:hypothetical protein Q8F55_006088 [Vanrija albida]|uniref:BTB domain-containing protein n=1 Tax=Vanrija albida TaxID=181172 RepID=A0ABR3Q3D4_9TREE